MKQFKEEKIKTDILDMMTPDQRDQYSYDWIQLSEDHKRLFGWLKPNSSFNDPVISKRNSAAFDRYCVFRMLY